MGLVAVVGGAGFVGVRLSATLRAEGHDVRVIDVVARETEEFGHQCADVRSRDSLAGALDGADVVYNLAAVHRDDVKPASLYDEVNVTGAVNVCDVCREIGVAQIVFASSVAVYGVAAPVYLRRRILSLSARTAAQSFVRRRSIVSGRRRSRHGAPW